MSDVSSLGILKSFETMPGLDSRLVVWTFLVLCLFVWISSTKKIATDFMSTDILEDVENISMVKCEGSFGPLLQSLNLYRKATDDVLVSYIYNTKDCKSHSQGTLSSCTAEGHDNTYVTVSALVRVPVGQTEYFGCNITQTSSDGRPKTVTHNINVTNLRTIIASKKITALNTKSVDAEMSLSCASDTTILVFLVIFIITSVILAVLLLRSKELCKKWHCSPDKEEENVSEAENLNEAEKNPYSWRSQNSNHPNTESDKKENGRYMETTAHLSLGEIITFPGNTSHINTNTSL